MLVVEWNSDQVIHVMVLVELFPQDAITSYSWFWNVIKASQVREMVALGSFMYVANLPMAVQTPGLSKNGQH